MFDIIKKEDVLKIITKKVDTVLAIYITVQNGKNVQYKDMITEDHFLVNPGETISSKYGDVVKKVIEVVEKKSINFC